MLCWQRPDQIMLCWQQPDQIMADLLGGGGWQGGEQTPLSWTASSVQLQSNGQRGNSAHAKAVQAYTVGCWLSGSGDGVTFWKQEEVWSPAVAVLGVLGHHRDDDYDIDIRLVMGSHDSLHSGCIELRAPLVR